MNELDELVGPTWDEGRDIRVIDRQLPVMIGFGSILFEVLLWLLVIPGIIFLFMKISAKNYFQKLQQDIQGAASEIDNYIEQRVRILANVAPLVARAIDLDKDVMKAVASLRSGHGLSETDRAAVMGRVDAAFGRLFPQVEAYPELRAHAAISDAMRQNAYLQKEITAARTFYNDLVRHWNEGIFAWPTKQIVAARSGYTTRIPFTASAEVRARAKGVFF